MPTINPNILAVGGGAVLVTWGPCVTGDVCAPVELARYSDKTVALVSGSFTGSFKGSNSPTFAGEFDLTDADNVGGPAVINNTLLGTGGTARGCVIRENPLMVRPVFSAGAAAVFAISCK